MNTRIHRQSRETLERVGAGSSSANILLKEDVSETATPAKPLPNRFYRRDRTGRIEPDGFISLCSLYCNCPTGSQAARKLFGLRFLVFAASCYSNLFRVPGFGFRSSGSAGLRSLWLILLLTTTGLPAAPLTTLNYQILGVELRVSPRAVAVPKGIAGSVLVQLVGGGVTNSATAELVRGAYIEATMRVPSFDARRRIRSVGGVMLLPLQLVGDCPLVRCEFENSCFDRITEVIP